MIITAILLAKCILFFFFLPAMILGYIAHGIHSNIIEPISHRHGIIAGVMTFIVYAPTVFVGGCSVIYIASEIIKAFK
ncbi:MAG: hypothetical protein MST12_07890 [Spirochaetia bacterium]|nr:hypothetical protein [Spirochaetia bacterium]